MKTLHTHTHRHAYTHISVYVCSRTKLWGWVYVLCVCVCAWCRCNDDNTCAYLHMYVYVPPTHFKLQLIFVEFSFIGFSSILSCLGSCHTAGDTYVYHVDQRSAITGGLQSLWGASEATIADQLDQYGSRCSTALTECSASAAQLIGCIGAQHQHTDHFGGVAGITHMFAYIFKQFWARLWLLQLARLALQLSVCVWLAALLWLATHRRGSVCLCLCFSLYDRVCVGVCCMTCWVIISNLVFYSVDRRNWIARLPSWIAGSNSYRAMCRS